MSNSNENIFDELKNKISGEIYTDKIRRYMHSTDGRIFRVEPACIVYPKNRQDVVEVVKFDVSFKALINICCLLLYVNIWNFVEVFVNLFHIFLSSL